MKIDLRQEHVVTTMHQPNYIAHQALKHRLHGRGMLERELVNLLRGENHEIAVTYVNFRPVCVALLTTWGQLMIFTRSKYRRLGLAKRTARLLSRRVGVKFELMVGGVGRKPAVSRGFFEAIGVELSDDYERVER